MMVQIINAKFKYVKCLVRNKHFKIKISAVPTILLTLKKKNHNRYSNNGSEENIPSCFRMSVNVACKSRLQVNFVITLIRTNKHDLIRTKQNK